MPEKEDFRKELTELIEHLLAICPPYNRVSIVLNEMRGNTMGEISSRYPEIFDEKILPTIVDLFGVRFGGEIDYDSRSVGYQMLEFIDKVREVLDNDKVRESIERNLGKNIPNPRRDYVKQCVETLKSEDPTALKLLNVIAEEGPIYEFDKLIEITLKRDLEVTKRDIPEYLDSLRQLRLVQWKKGGESVSIVDVLKRHIMELVD